MCKTAMTTNNYSRWSTLLVILGNIKYRLVPYLFTLQLKYGFLGQKSQSSLEIGLWEKRVLEYREKSGL